jgi:hypothetical protein
LTLCFIFYDFGLIYVLYRSRTIFSPGALRVIGRPEAKKEDEITKMAEAIMDEAVTRLLNKVAEAVLKEE